MNHSARRNRRRFAVVIAVMILVLAGVAIGLHLRGGQEPGSQPVGGDVTPTPTPDLTIRPVATATLGNTGDILIHSPILTATKQSDGSYRFDNIFSVLAPYVNAVDFATINLELTLPGSKYQGYPTFRTPDSLVDSILTAGFDLVTTANNHANDSGENGMVRTTQVLTEKGLPYTGTRTQATDKNYRVQSINGIKVGMVSYTHGAYLADGRKSINAIPCTTDSSQLINMFAYDRLDEFYDDMAEDIANMKAEGAEALLAYIHWGDEYHIQQNKTQEAMAQKLSDLGIDVIVGCHPHVVQPVTVIESEVSGKSTLCVYSMGNAVSNQRIAQMDDIKTGHTEDGMFVTFTFTKYSDGSVRVTGGEILPTWVHLYTQDGRKVYQIVPLDKGTEDWSGELGLGNSSNGVRDAEKSYDRTMAIVGDGLAEWEAFFQAQQQELDDTNRALRGESPSPEQ